jgi:hypothetical protein
MKLFREMIINNQQFKFRLNKMIYGHKILLKTRNWCFQKNRCLCWRTPSLISFWHLMKEWQDPRTLFKWITPQSLQMPNRFPRKSCLKLNPQIWLRCRKTFKFNNLINKSLRFKAYQRSWRHPEMIFWECLLRGKKISLKFRRIDNRKQNLQDLQNMSY